MGKNITIRCANTGRSHRVPVGYNLEELYEMLDLQLPYGATSAKVNNKVEGLHYMFFSDKDVEFLDITSPSGLRTYTRSLLIKTSQIYLFDIVPYGDGVLLRLPDPANPSELRPMIKQPKMFGVFREHHRWNEILGVSTIGTFNKACDTGHTNDLINVSEALQEKSGRTFFLYLQELFL